MTRKINGLECSTPWEEAIARAGGPTEFGRRIGMTYQRVRQIQTSDAKTTDRASVAKKVEEKTGVPAAEILGLVEWNPDSRPEGNGRRLRLVEGSTDTEAGDDAGEESPADEPTLVPVPGLTASARAASIVRPYSCRTRSSGRSAALRRGDGRRARRVTGARAHQ